MKSSKKLRILDLLREEVKNLKEAPQQVLVDPNWRPPSYDPNATQPGIPPTSLPPPSLPLPGDVTQLDPNVSHMPGRGPVPGAQDYTMPTTPPPLPSQSSGFPAGYQAGVTPQDLALAQVGAPGTYVDPAGSGPTSQAATFHDFEMQKIRAAQQAAKAADVSQVPAVPGGGTGTPPPQGAVPAQSPDPTGGTIPNFPAYQAPDPAQQAAMFGGVSQVNPVAQLPNLLSLSPGYTADPGTAHLPPGDVPYSQPRQQAQWPPTSDLREPVEDDFDLNLPKLSEVYKTLAEGPMDWLKQTLGGSTTASVSPVTQSVITSLQAGRLDPRAWGNFLRTMQSSPNYDDLTAAYDAGEKTGKLSQQQLKQLADLSQQMPGGGTDLVSRFETAYGNMSGGVMKQPVPTTNRYDFSGGPKVGSIR